MSHTDEIGIILLAAGNSQRFGPTNKLLSPFHGKPLICHVAQALATAQIGQIYAITGHQSDAIMHALSAIECQQIHNTHHHTGIASSIATGITALRDRYDHLMIALGDTPHILPEHIHRIAQYHLSCQTPRQMITRPRYGTQFGHPVIWGAVYFDKLSCLTGDVGGQHLITDVNSRIIDFDDQLPATDYDHKDDLK